MNFFCKSMFSIGAMAITHGAFAMPCDTGYACKSASGTYEIHVQSCRYDNHVGNFLQLKVNGLEVTDATLNPDAKWDGHNVLAFQIDLPQLDEELRRSLSLEAQKKGNSIRGVLRDMTRIANPGPWKTTKVESISCEVDG